MTKVEPFLTVDRKVVRAVSTWEVDIQASILSVDG